MSRFGNIPLAVSAAAAIALTVAALRRPRRVERAVLRKIEAGQSPEEIHEWLTASGGPLDVGALGGVLASAFFFITALLFSYFPWSPQSWLGWGLRAALYVCGAALGTLVWLGATIFVGDLPDKLCRSLASSPNETCRLIAHKLAGTATDGAAAPPPPESRDCALCGRASTGYRKRTYYSSLGGDAGEPAWRRHDFAVCTRCETKAGLLNAAGGFLLVAGWASLLTWLIEWPAGLWSWDASGGRDPFLIGAGTVFVGVAMMGLGQLPAREARAVRRERRAAEGRWWPVSVWDAKEHEQEVARRAAARRAQAVLRQALCSRCGAALGVENRRASEARQALHRALGDMGETQFLFQGTAAEEAARELDKNRPDAMGETAMKCNRCAAWICNACATEAAGAAVQQLVHAGCGGVFETPL